MAQSNNKIFGTSEITSDKQKFVSGVMEVTGNVYALGEKAQITLKGKDGSAGAVLFAKDDVLQFSKRGGDDLVPKETVLTKLYE